MNDVSDKLYLTQWRRSKGLSQEALAHEIGYSRSTIAAAETRHYNATLAFLVAYAQGVGAPSVGALFSHPDVIDTDAHELNAIFTQIKNKFDRATVLQVARSLSEKQDVDNASDDRSDKHP